MKTIQEILNKKSANDLYAISLRAEDITREIDNKENKNKIDLKRKKVSQLLRTDALNLLKDKYNKTEGDFEDTFLLAFIEGNYGIGNWNYLFSQYNI